MRDVDWNGLRIDADGYHNVVPLMRDVDWNRCALMIAPSSCLSSLLWGTWIEIQWICYYCRGRCRRPSYEGRGLKWVFWASCIMDLLSSLLWGTWIEIQSLQSANSVTRRRPSYEGRGLKSIDIRRARLFAGSSLLWGTWIEILIVMRFPRFKRCRPSYEGRGLKFNHDNEAVTLIYGRPSYEGRGLKCPSTTSIWCKK